MPQDATERPARAGIASQGQDLAALYFFNVFATVFAGSGVLAGLGRERSLVGWFAALLAAFSNALILNAVVAAPFAAALFALKKFFPSRASAPRWLLELVAPIAWGLAVALVYTDSVVYRVFRAHLYNGLVLNVLFTPGASDSLTAGTGTVLYGIFAVAFILAAELAFARWGLAFLRNRLGALLGTRKAKLTCAAAVLGCIFADKTVYALADLTDRTEITALRNVLPLYLPLTVKRFASRELGLELGVSKVRAGQTLMYPKAPIQFRPDAASPNILIVCIEGARFDVLRPDVMPNLCRFAEESWVFERHFSSGNCSRTGVFGLLYGIDGTYWQNFLAARQGPVLITELVRRGYAVSIMSCTDLNFPEFRRTAFVDVPEAITDQWDCPRVERDRLMTDRFLEFLATGRRPFFAFLFYDASHQPYLYPSEHEVFRTSLGPEINYVELASNMAAYAPELRLRYLNSLHYIDSQISRLLDALRGRGLLQETLVFVTGDHGEEFGELGLFGHNTTFTRYQAGVIMVARLPGEPPRRVGHLTSHIDVVPTIMTFLGVVNPVSDYSQGLPLTVSEGPSHVFSAGWDAAGIIEEGSILTYGLEVYNSYISVTDWDNRKLPEQSAELAKRRNLIVEALARMREFIR